MLRLPYKKYEPISVNQREEHWLHLLILRVLTRRLCVHYRLSLILYRKENAILLNTPPAHTYLYLRGERK
jgi:hypothetical protein